MPDEKKGIYCNDHSATGMIDVSRRTCLCEKCYSRPVYNISSEKIGLYCSKHKNKDMVIVSRKKCNHEDCQKEPNFNLPTETVGIYCKEHKSPTMMSVKIKSCQHPSCKNKATHGLPNKRPQFCHEHQQPNMINLLKDKQCQQENCTKDYTIIHNNTKYCLEHSPDKTLEVVLKRKCKYCDIEESSTYVCDECKQIMHKKEWTVIRHLRKNINTPFTHDSSKMLQGCSKRRPDVYFELDTHCVIVEVDEDQHKSYSDICECSRISEIVSGIGGKSVVFIRYNPDKIMNKKKTVKVSQEKRLEKLVEVVKQELTKDHERFTVKLIQLYYNDDNKVYESMKEEDITDLVVI